MTRVEIVIDELVVRGVAPEAARAAARALESRLALLAGEADGPVHSREEAFRRLPAVDVRAWAPADLGDAVAGALWGAIASADARDVRTGGRA